MPKPEEEMKNKVRLRKTAHCDERNDDLQGAELLDLRDETLAGSAPILPSGASWSHVLRLAEILAVVRASEATQLSSVA